MSRLIGTAVRQPSCRRMEYLPLPSSSSLSCRHVLSLCAFLLLSSSLVGAATPYAGQRQGGQSHQPTSCCLESLAGALPAASARGIQSSQDVQALGIEFEELSRVASGQDFQLTDVVRGMYGAGAAYISGFRRPHRWARVNPWNGQVTLADDRGNAPGQFLNVAMATGTQKGPHFVLHDGRLSIVSNQGDYIAGHFIPGRPLVARADSNAGARIVVHDSGAPLEQQTSIITVDANGSVDSWVHVRGVQLGQGWAPHSAAVGAETVYLAGYRGTSDFVLVDFRGQIREVWRHAPPWADLSTDKYGRPNSMILGVHEVDDLLLVVTAVRHDDAIGLFGGYRGFIEKNEFYLEALDRKNGQVLATSIHEQPPFFGGITEEVVYRIEVGPDEHDTPEVVFLFTVVDYGRQQ